LTADVYLVDDDLAVRESLEQSLLLSGLDVKSWPSAEAAIEAIETDGLPMVVITDVRLGGADGLQLLQRLKAMDPTLPVILITGHGDVPMAVQAMRDGAHDFVEKPFTPSRLITTTRRAIDQRGLLLENRVLRAQIDRHHATGLLGQSAPMHELRRMVAALAPTDIDVLLLGETGTGKELVARALHDSSGRRGPFVAFNCGAVPETVFESEMFGHEPGAFTGAQKRRIGKFEYASRGTLFLDEVESMPLPLQAKVLRAIQERTIQRLGSNLDIAIDGRVIAATKVDLLEEVRAGRFREDLYYRLEVATIPLPPLRDRLDDVPLLFGHFVSAAARRHGLEPPAWTPHDMSRWQQQAWPGNVRELRNTAERWTLGIERGQRRAEPSPVSTLAEVLARTERHCIEAALRDASGQVAAAAAQLGLPRKTLYDKLARLEIDAAHYRSDGGRQAQAPE